MIKSELVQRIASQNPHLFQRDIEKIVNAIFDEMVEALRRGDRVELRGFGAFSARLRGPHQGRNPRTGAVVPVAKKAWPYFMTGKKMRVRLNQETAGVRSLFGQDPRSPHGAQPAYWRRRPNLKESYSRLQDGKGDARAA